MPPAGRGSKRLAHGEIAWDHAERGDLDPMERNFRAPLTIATFPLNPIPVCSQINNYDRDQLWTSRTWLVDGLATQLR